MIYIGYVQPFKSALANKLELFNETMFKLGGYGLIVFTDFVPDAITRADCGWYLIGVTLFMLLVNFSFMTIINVKQVFRKIRLQCLRRRHMKL